MMLTVGLTVGGTGNRRKLIVANRLRAVQPGGVKQNAQNLAA
jgi:hypothetical protein